MLILGDNFDNTTVYIIQYCTNIYCLQLQKKRGIFNLIGHSNIYRVYIFMLFILVKPLSHIIQNIIPVTKFKKYKPIDVFIIIQKIQCTFSFLFFISDACVYVCVCVCVCGASHIYGTINGSSFVSSSVVCFFYYYYYMSFLYKM